MHLVCSVEFTQKAGSSLDAANARLWADFCCLWTPWAGCSRPKQAPGLVQRQLRLCSDAPCHATSLRAVLGADAATPSLPSRLRQLRARTMCP